MDMLLYFDSNLLSLKENAGLCVFIIIIKTHG